MKNTNISNLLREIMTEDKNRQTAEHLGKLRGALMHVQTLAKAERPYSEILAYVEKALGQVSSSDPLSETEGDKKLYTKQELIDYLGKLDKNTQVVIPTIYDKAFSQTSQGSEYTASEAIAALVKSELDGEFERYMNNPNFKKFSLVKSAEQNSREEDLVGSMMGSRR